MSCQEQHRTLTTRQPASLTFPCSAIELPSIAWLDTFTTTAGPIHLCIGWRCTAWIAHAHTCTVSRDAPSTGCHVSCVIMDATYCTFTYFSCSLISRTLSALLSMATSLFVTVTVTVLTTLLLTSRTVSPLSSSQTAPSTSTQTYHVVH